MSLQRLRIAFLGIFTLGVTAQGARAIPPIDVAPLSCPGKVIQASVGQGGGAGARQSVSDEVHAVSLEEAVAFRKQPLERQLQSAIDAEATLTLVDYKNRSYPLQILSVRADGSFTARLGGDAMAMVRVFQSKYFDSTKTLTGKVPKSFEGIGPEVRVTVRNPSGTRVSGHVLGFTDDGDLRFFDVDRQTLRTMQRSELVTEASSPKIPGFDPSDVPPRTLQGVTAFRQQPLETQLALAAEYKFPVTLTAANGTRVSVYVMGPPTNGVFQTLPALAEGTDSTATVRPYQMRFFEPQKTVFGVPPAAFNSVAPEQVIGLKLANGNTIQGHALGFTPSGDLIFFDLQRQKYGSFKRERITLQSLASEAPTRRIAASPVVLVGGQQGVAQRVLPGGTVAASTDMGKGQKYRYNEDSIFVDQREETAFLGVIDGMGGMGGGQRASAIIADSLREAVLQGERLPLAVNNARDRLAQAVAAGEINTGSGAAAVMAKVENGQLDMVSVGDSKGILVRGRKVVAQTKDHSRVQEMIDRKEITEAEAMLRNDRNLVTLAISDDMYKRHNGILSAHRATSEVRRGDWIVLASDGLWDNLTADEVAEAIAEAPNAETARAILRRLFEKGGGGRAPHDDNISIIVMRVEDA